MSRVTLIVILAVATGATLVLSAVLTALARRTALRIGFVDRPGHHKSHTTPTPYGGGAAIILAGWLTIGVLMVVAHVLPVAWISGVLGENIHPYIGGMRDRTTQMLAILAGGIVLHVLGTLDDKNPLRPGLKLLVIIAVALFVATFGRVRAELAGSAIAVPLTVAWFVVIINAFNFLDNMDGLSAGIAGICLLFLAVCGLMAGQVLVPALACVFLGTVGGFLLFNFPPARIFMGDAGSLVVGYMLAVTSVLTTYYRMDQDAPPYALAMPLVILAIPLYDFTSVILIRVLEGRNPMKGDQRHFSHRLVDRGLSRRFAVLTIYLATATTGLAATLMPGADLRRTITIGVIVLMVLAIVAILEAPFRKAT